MIKLITFDLWNTLISDTGSSEVRKYRIEKLKKMFAEGFGREFTDEEINSSIQHSWKVFTVEWDTRGYTPTSSYMVKQMFEHLNLEHTNSVFEPAVELMETALHRSESAFVQGIEELLERVKYDYALAVISDTGFTPGRHLREVLKKRGVFRYFTMFAFSDEIGVAKPDRRIFEYVLSRTGAKPHEAVHIGDLLKTDIKGAKNAGMKAVHFTKEVFIKEDRDDIVPDFSTDDTDKIFEFIRTL